MKINNLGGRAVINACMCRLLAIKWPSRKLLWLHHSGTEVTAERYETLKKAALSRLLKAESTAVKYCNGGIHHLPQETRGGTVWYDSGMAIRIRLLLMKYNQSNIITYWLLHNQKA